MKIIPRMLLCGVLMWAGVVCAFAQTEQTEGIPQIKFDQTVYDFGTTSLVNSVVGTFTFQNVGTGVLKVQRPSTSCGCTVAGVTPDTLKPGEKGELVFTFALAGIRGHSEKSITVPSNDPHNPVVKLTVKADVKQVYEAVPPQVGIGDIRLGATTNVVVLLRRTDGQKLQVKKTETSSDLVRAQIQPEEDSHGQAVKLLVEVEGRGAPRRFSEQIRVFTEETPQPVLTVSVHGRLLGDVVLTPEALFWGITDPDRWPGQRSEAMTVRRVIVTSTQTDRPLEVQNVTSSLKELSVELVALEPGKSYAVVARLPEPPRHTERGTISFQTNMPGQPTVVVPVTINVLRR